MTTQKGWITIGKFLVEARWLESRPLRRCSLAECKACCCSHGVLVDKVAAKRIVEHAELVKQHLPEERRSSDSWFSKDEKVDTDYPSGHAVTTRVLKHSERTLGSGCVFLRPDNKCALQIASVASGRHPWELKPFYCALFPVTIEGNYVLLDDSNDIFKRGGNCGQHSNTLAPLYRIYQEELVLALGQDGYEQLCEIADKSENL